MEGGLGLGLGSPPLLCGKEGRAPHVLVVPVVIPAQALPGFVGARLLAAPARVPAAAASPQAPNQMISLGRGFFFCIGAEAVVRSCQGAPRCRHPPPLPPCHGEWWCFLPPAEDRSGFEKLPACLREVSSLFDGCELD